MVAGNVLVQPWPLSRRSRLGSHAVLTCDARARPASSNSSPIDAVIVPTSRGATAVDGAAYLAARLNTRLVVMCSGATKGSDVAARLAASAGSTALIVDVPGEYRHELLPTRTAAPRFTTIAKGRHNDLSLKRNLGLLLARLHGWGKILFLDDDIGESVDGLPVGIPLYTAHRLAAQLDEHQVAGLACREYPDNSVYCHARRLVGLPQDTFVSGAALGVNCSDQPLPFFPEQYNEDWFFFSRLTARRDLAHAGYARQHPYDPFADPDRARQEEFGDLLAEGLYELFEDQPEEMSYFRRFDDADAMYWDRCIAMRRENMYLIARMLRLALDREAQDANEWFAALRSVEAALDQLSTLTPELCVEYLDAWQSDLDGWERATQRIRVVRHTTTALQEFLGLSEWRSIGWETASRAA
jgi:hypothetical protein